jgi:hypothetical protein
VPTTKTPSALPRNKVTAKVGATAKAHAIVKATYQRKRTITEIIPEDVTRAKAGRWLDLISPITEWAGLKGDALRFKRSQLRVQQEAALERLADSVRDKMKGHPVIYPLPPKILVPALEAASLEAPDSPLIDWWAHLLVSGAVRAPLRPFLIDLMSKIGIEEAIFLETMWNKFSDVGLNLYDPQLVVAIHQGMVSNMVNQFFTENAQYADDAFDQAMDERAQGYGIGLTSQTIINDGGYNIFVKTSENIRESGVPIRVCRALSILDVHEWEAWLHGPRPPNVASMAIEILAFTVLGIEFMRATR